jgi:tripartite-type tricarboxylate transporter receptor subunit TctC
MNPKPTASSRRRALRAACLAALAAGALAPVAAAAAQADWPAKPIRVIVPYAAGGVVDVMTRAVTTRMPCLVR